MQGFSGFPAGKQPVVRIPNTFFTELLPRIKTIELAGEPEAMATTFVGGLKHLPIRVELK